MMMTNVTLPSTAEEAAEPSSDEGAPEPTVGRKFSKTVLGTPPGGIDLESAVPDTREHAKLPARGKFKKTMMGTLPPAISRPPSEPAPETVAVSETAAPRTGVLSDSQSDEHPPPRQDTDSELEELKLPTRSSGSALIVFGLLTVGVAVLLAWLSTR